MGLTYQCPVCAKSYFEKAKLKKHFTITGHSSKGKPAKYAGPLKAEVSRSVRGHQNQQQSSRDILPVSTSISADFTYDDRPLYCKVCKVMLKSKQQYKRHLLGPLHAQKAAKARQNPNVHTCPKCDKGFTSVMTLQRHQLMMNHHVAASQIIYLPQPQSSSIEPQQPRTNTFNNRSQTMNRVTSSFENLGFNVGRQCLVCMKKYGDSRKLMMHLLKAQHKIAHLRMKKTKPVRKVAMATPRGKTDELQCLVCYRPYTTSLKLRKHLSSTKHRSEHDRLSGSVPTRYRRVVIPTTPVTVPSDKCFYCGRVYEDEKKLAKHFSNTGHKAEHNRLKEQIEVFAAKHIDLTKPIPEDQCLQCGRIAGNKEKLLKHFSNTKHKLEHFQLQAKLPQIPVDANQTPVKKTDVTKSTEENSGHKCLCCNTTYPDGKALNRHLQDTKHKEEHDQLHYKQIMKAVVSTPKVHVEKLSPEKTLKETSETKKIESVMRSPRRSHGKEAMETEISTSSKAPIGGKIEQTAKNGKKCLVCGKAYSTRRALRKHLQRTLHRTQHDALEKAKLSRGPSAQKIVIKTSLFKPGLMKVTCEKCKRRFPTRSVLQMHMKKVHGSRMPGIKKISSTETATKEPEASENIQCDVCEKQFPRLSNLKKHYFNAHRQYWQPKDPECPVGEAKSMPVQEPASEESVDEENTMSCYLCDRQFPRLSSLKKHVFNSHKQLWNEQDASKLAKDKQHPENPVETTSTPLKEPVLETPEAEENTESCYLCDRQFPRLSNLKKHVFNAHKQLWNEQASKLAKEKPGETPATHMKLAEDECFQCHLCEKQFNNITPMKHHVFAAHGQFLPPDTAPQKVKPTKSPTEKTDSTFRCELCDKEFITITRLKQHTFARHHQHLQPAATPQKTFPPAVAVTPDVQQRIKKTQPVVRVHKLSVDPDTSISEYEAEEQVRDCEETESKSLFTQLKKHLKTIAQLERNDDAAQDSNEVQTLHDVTESTDETPSKRQKIATGDSKQSMPESTGYIKCRVCDLTFINSASLKRHMKSKKHRWFCPVCHVSYSKVKSLLAHKATHTTSSESNKTDSTQSLATLDSRSGDSTAKSKLLSQGILKNLPMDASDNESEGLPVLPPLDESDDASSTSSHKCKHCSDCFSTRKELIHHKEEKHIIFKCKHCPQKFDSELELLNHMLMHRSSTPKQHVENRNGPSNAVPIISESEEAAELDMSVEEGSPMYNPWSDGEDDVASETGSSHKQPGTVVMKKTNKSENVDIGGDGDSEFACTQCGENFNSACDLEDHILKSHVSVVPQVHQCKICSVTFKHKRSYTRHMARGKHRQANMQHKGSPSQAKDQDLDDRSSNNSEQCGDDEHNTSDVKLYECPECASVFLQERGLVNHIKLGIHTECRVCHKTYADAIELRAHMPEHRTEESTSTENEKSALTENEQVTAEIEAKIAANEKTITENENNCTDQEDKVDAEVAAHSESVDGSGDRSDCVSPSELLDWIAQAKERIGNEQATNSNAPTNEQYIHQSASDEAQTN